MNRQARIVLYGRTDETEIIPMTDWEDFGSVTFFEAVKRLALKESAPMTGVVLLNIQTRDLDEPSIPPAVFKVEVTREARILNPRRDTDRVVGKGLFQGVQALIRGSNA